MKTRCLLVAAAFSFLGLSVRADDWPQWRGRDRTDISKETGLLKTWPKDGPKLLWTNPDCGIGFSGPAVVGDRLYLMGARNNTESVLALDVRTGKELWSARIGTLFVNNWGDGPRGTPTLDGDFLYVLGGQGDLVCLATATGKERWRLSMQRDLKGRMMTGWGYTESPLVDGDKLVCTPGGALGTFAALDKKTGKVLWRSKDLTEPAAYSSIVIADMGKVRQYINMTGNGVAAAAADGRFLWRNDLSANRTAIVPTPIFHDNHVYVSSGYGAGCGLLKLTQSGAKIDAERVYANKIMTNHHGGVVLLDGYLYGFSDSGGWVCQEFMSGKSVWQNRSLGKGSLTCADGRLYCYSENDGTAVLIEASPKAWTEHGRFKIPQQTKINRKSGKIWTHPVIANGRLYLRDQELLFSLDIRDVASER